MDRGRWFGTGDAMEVDDQHVESTSIEVDSGLASRRADRRNEPRRRSDETWQKILTGAAQVFQERGYGNATLEDVAAKVDMNHASLYYYIGTKAELLTEVLWQPILDMTKDLAEVRNSSLPPTKMLTEAIACHIRALAGAITPSSSSFLLKIFTF